MADGDDRLQELIDRWVKPLSKQLSARTRIIATFEAYYNGDHRLQFASEKFREAFGGLFNELSDNWCELVVEAVEERLNPVGFRISPDETRGDGEAWDIWQRNQMDAESQVAHTEALINGEASALVWPDRDNEPEITVEHPREMIVVHAAGTRRQRVGAFKKWLDDSGFVFGTLYLPDGVYKFQSEAKLKSEASTDTSFSELGIIEPSEIRWTVREVDGEEWPVANPFKAVPVVALPNKPRMLRRRGTAMYGQSEIRKLIPIQDAVNMLVADMLVAAEFAAYKQRWATGLEIPEDPQTHQPIEPFEKAIGRLWVSEDENTKFGEFTESQLSNYVTAIEMFVQHAASQTRTPPHYFFLRGQFPSGESIKAAETGLVAKARRKTVHFGEGWEEIIRLALILKGRKREELARAETIWGDPESRSESELVDAASKKLAIGVPQQQLWEDVGYSPTQIDRFKAMRTEEALEVGGAFDPFAGPSGNGARPEPQPVEE